jgi:F-type H+-transporting ATPase subunit beta
MNSTDGLRRGQEAEDTGSPIKVPVGKNVLGHMFNVLGEPIDGSSFEATEKNSIHREAPKFAEQSKKQRFLKQESRL